MSDSDKNMFLFVGTYASEEEAQVDYETVLGLHDLGAVGSYDVGIVYKDADGKLDIKRHTDTTGKGGWRGAAVGALVGLVFPPSLIGASLVGAGAGAAIGHSMNDISKDDLKQVGEVMQEEQAALVVIGESKLREKIQEAVNSAMKEYSKEFQANAEDFEKQLEEAEKEMESSSDTE